MINMLPEALRSLMTKYGMKAKGAHLRMKRTSPSYKDIVDSEEMHNITSAVGLKNTNKEAKAIANAKRSVDKSGATKAKLARLNEIISMKAIDIRKEASFKEAKKSNPKLTPTQYKAIAKKILKRHEGFSPDKAEKRAKSINDMVEKRKNVRKGVSGAIAATGAYETLGD